MQENWKDVADYRGLYEVSNLGRVKSYKCNLPKILKPRLNQKGYHRYALTKDNKRKEFQGHQLVAMAFLNHKVCGHKYVIDHIDNNPQNNSLENLQILTNRDNCIKINKGKSSRYTGVHYCNTINKYISRIQINGKKIIIGSYLNELDASRAYKEYYNLL